MTNWSNHLPELVDQSRILILFFSKFLCHSGRQAGFSMMKRNLPAVVVGLTENK